MVWSDLFAPDGYIQEYELFYTEEELDELVEEAVDIIEGYTAHEAQWILHDCSARFRIMTCGRRWGKTLACAAEMIKFALENDDVLCWWVAPFYRQTEIAYRIISRAIEPYVVKNSKGSMRIELDNVSVIEFRSAENYDALRGEGVSFLVVDEAALIAREAWEEALRPTLSDTMGRAIFISTPKGRNWFFELYMRGQDDEYPEYQSFTFPTSSNPYIPKKELEDVKKTLPKDVYKQEYEAEFLEESAGVFRGIRKCVQGELEEPREDGVYVASWDIARTTDYSVVTIMDVHRRHVVYFDRFNQIDWKTQIDRVERAVKRYNNAKLWMDSTGVGDAVLENVYERGIDAEGFKFTPVSKQQLIHNLQLMISEQAITFPEIKELINELIIFQYEITEAGNIRYSAPAGGHDDCVMSLALACWGLKEYAPLQLFA